METESAMMPCQAQLKMKGQTIVLELRSPLYYVAFRRCLRTSLSSSHPLLRTRPDEWILVPSILAKLAPTDLWPILGCVIDARNLY